MAEGLHLATAPSHRPLTSDIGPGLIWGFRADAEGVATPITDERMIGAQDSGWVWLHFNLADMRAKNWLATSPIVPKPGPGVFLSGDDAQRLVATEHSILGVVFDLVHGFDRDNDEFGHLCFVLNEHILISGRRRALNSVEAIRREIELGRRFTSTTDLLRAIIDQLATGLDKIVEELTTEVDSIEDSILGDLELDERQRLGRVRLTTVRIHRRLNGLRTLFRRMAGDQSAGLAALIRGATASLLQRLDEIDQEVVEVRDRARLLQDEITIKLAEQTNRHLHVLSILTALLLPPTLVAGLFGMNLQGLPFTASGHGFWWAVIFTVASSGIAVWVLRRMGVLRRRSRL